MNYVLAYRDTTGPHFTPGLATLDAVNDEIHRLNDQHDEVVIMHIDEEAHDGSRTWQIEYPPAPPAGTRVTTKSGTTEFTVGDGGLIKFAEMNYSWREALESFGPLTEVVETEVEAAARRLREGLPKVIAQSDHDDLSDVRIVLNHVLNGGQLDA